MATAFPLEGVRYELTERRERQHDVWETHGDVRAFLRDWIVPAMPGLGVALADCRMSYRLYRSMDRANRYKLTAFSCTKLPWCLPCTSFRTWTRLRKIEDWFSEFTPPGKEPQAIHGVFTAPLTEGGEGWGAKAAANQNAFMQVVKDALEAFFGRGLGGHMSYQDFGEQPFRKKHPHVDFLLNGWRVRDGAIVPVKEPEFDRPGERERLNLAYDGATALFGFDLGPGNSYLSRMKVGLRSLRGALAYSARELVDLRKIVYDGPKAGRVGWESYRDGTVDWMMSSGFGRWYAEYDERVRPHRPNTVHRGFGYMWKPKRGLAESLGFSGEGVRHAPECVCTACEDWERVMDHPELAAKGVRLAVTA